MGTSSSQNLVQGDTSAGADRQFICSKKGTGKCSYYLGNVTFKCTVSKVLKLGPFLIGYSGNADFECVTACQGIRQL